MSAKRDALVFTPVDVKAMVPSVQKINAAGIPLVNVGDRLPAAPPSRSSAPTITASRSRPRARLLKAMGGKGNVVVLEGPDTVPRRPPGCAVSRTR